MDRYQKLKKPKPESPINENEIRITTQGAIQLADLHQARLANIRKFSWHPMLQLDFGILTTFGWDQDVRRYIQGIGWDFLLREPPSRIYRTATMEFLASVTMVDIPSPIPGIPPAKAVSYWMNGAYRSSMLDSFNIIMGFHQTADTSTVEYMTAYCERPATLTTSEMWEDITGSQHVPTHLKGTTFLPPLRICHKLLAGTLHSRKESQGKVTLADLFVIYCMHRGYRCNPGYFFLKALKDFGTRGPARTIMMALLITPLAEYWGCPDGEDIPTALRPELIDGSMLANMSILTRQGTGFVLHPHLSVANDFHHMDSSQSQKIPIPPEFQQQHYEHDFVGVHRHMDDEHAYMESQFQFMRQQFDQITLRQERYDQRQEGLIHRMYDLMQTVGGIKQDLKSLIQSQEEFQRRMLR